MSVATKSYVSSYGNSQHTDEVSGRSSPRSPRGSTSRPAQSSNRITPSLPTPANSVVGIPGLEMADDIDQHRDKRPRLEKRTEEEADQMEIEPLTQATNHDRQEAMVTEDDPASKAQGTNLGGDRLVVDETTLEQLQKDMGEAFLLCRSSKTLLTLTTYRTFWQVC